MCVCVCERVCECMYVYVCACASVCACAHMHLMLNRCAVAVSLRTKLYSHCSSPPNCTNRDLVLVREANGKLIMSRLSGWGLGGTMGAHTIIHETWPVLLQGTNPPRRVCPHWLKASAYVVCRHPRVGMTMKMAATGFCVCNKLYMLIIKILHSN